MKNLVLSLTMLITVVWTIAVSGSLIWNIRYQEKQVMDTAYAEARANLNKDITMRRWMTEQGGVYVPITDQQPSVPWLKHVPGRDVMTTDGRALTLLNPATVLRQMMDRYAKDYGVRGRITGLKYLNPGNAPDSWEKQQLEAFTTGQKKEVWAIADLEGKPHLRYLRAMFMEPGCVKCHGILGYKVGDMRGATGVNLPLEEYYQQIENARFNMGVSHLLIWLFGIIGIAWTYHVTKQNEKRRQKSQIALQNSEARLRALFNNNAVAIIVIDEQGRIEEFNPGSEAIFAYSKAEVIGKNINILMPEPYAVQHDGYIKNYLNTRLDKIPRIDREVVGQRRGNVSFPMEVLLGQAILNNRRVFIGFITDISKRKQMEGINRQFQAIVQSSDDAIISKTLAGVVNSWNPGAEKLFGYSAAEMIGDTILKLLPLEYHDDEKRYMEQIAHGQQVDNFETVRICKNGTLIDVSVSLSPVFDETGKIIGVSKIARDITRNKQLQHELLTAKQAAEAANRSKSEFLANMSHEIRTPLNAVIGLTRLVMDTELTAKQHDYLSKVQTSSLALLNILNDILDLSKIEAGRLDIEQTEFDPTLILQSVSDLFVAKVEEKGLEIFLDVAPEMPLTVMGDPLRIQQVLSNLVSNAIKFTPKGEIYIRAEVENSDQNGLLLRFSVRDSGIGISEDNIAMLFQSFSQADTSITRKFGGTGLGLAISKQLVGLMGGSISVASTPGKGSTFSFSIRCGKGQVYNWKQDSYCLKDKRVLVVDDQETSCTILKNILESWHLQVETALSAELGLEKIYAAERAGKPFDLLLLDWKLKGMSGLAMAHKLGLQTSASELQHHPTIVMVTAYRKELLEQELFSTATHIDTILTKPIIPSALLNTILHVYRSQNKENFLKPKTPLNPYQLARPLRNTQLLLVEDNELNQQVAQEFLEKAGLRVSLANHGGEAIQWLQKTDFDVVLMDLQMPEMDGFEATRRIRQLPNCRNLPIIAMTAAAMQNDREQCLAAGMNAHVAKPIQPIELINTLLRWLKTEVAEPVLIAAGSEKNVSALAEKLPGFDLHNIMTLLADDEEKLLRMLLSFREQFIVEFSGLVIEIAGGDFESAKKNLHTLKGAAGNLGAKALHDICTALEAELINGQYQPATLAQWLKIFHQSMDSIAALALPQSSVTPAVIEGESFSQIVAQLDTLLANDDFINDVLLLQLKKLLPEEQQADYARLAQFILDTDYTKARSILNTLRGLPNENQ